MKKTIQKIVSVFLVFALMNLQGFANVGVFSDMDFSMNDSEITNFDEDAFYAEFDDVSSLENYLETSDATYAELELAESDLLVNVSPDPMLPFADDVESEGPALGIPSFLWGCLLTWVGILIVYLVTENPDETKKALWGCVVNGVVGTILYVVIYAAAWSTYSY